MIAQRNKFYVPWSDMCEWNTVREQLFSCDIRCTLKAYETILMWKLKYDSVPAYIECTYTLLQVMIKEYEMTKNKNSSLLINEYDLQLSYSTALIRFVNHVSSISSYKGETLYLAARTQNIPDWIINMRHDAAHGQDLPTLDALHIAADLSLKWLLDNYWASADHFEENTLDVSQSDNDFREIAKADIEAQNFFTKVFEVWELCHCTTGKQMKINAGVNKEFFLHVEEMISLNYTYFGDVENHAINTIQKLVNIYNYTEGNNKYISETASFKIKNFKILLLDCLKNIIKVYGELKQSLVVSLTQTTFVQDKNFNPVHWTEVICFFQEIGSFSILLQILFQMAGKGDKGAAKWLSVLPPSIRHLRKQWAIFRVLKKEHNNFKTKLLKKRVEKSCKVTDEKLIIKLGIFKPPFISLEMMKSVLLNPEQFVVKDIVELLKLVKPPLLKGTINMIRDLINLQTIGEIENSEEKENLEKDKIFTLEDLHQALVQHENLPIEEAKNEKDGWIKTNIDIHTWNKCPLGLLPFQAKVDCNLPESLSWKTKVLCRKRGTIPLLHHSITMKKIKKMKEDVNDVC